tara:strand:- start:5971 stop:6411 length:441 start_codon:yes stop_codon:yes gene_type:complete
MTSFFSKSTRNQFRKKIVNFLYDLIKLSEFNENIVSYVIKSWHFVFPYMSFLLYMCAPLVVGYILLIILLLFWGLFIYLEGCFLSYLEYKLSKETYVNVMDPYLLLGGWEINNKNRFNMTIFIVNFYFLVSFLIIYVRLKIRNKGL